MQRGRAKRNSGSLRRPRQCEPLEPRMLLASDLGTSAFTNTGDRYDINNDGVLTALDALTIINDFDRNGSRQLGTLSTSNLRTASAQSSATTTSYLDPSGDGYITPLDALLVINALDRPRVSLITKLTDTSGTAITSVTAGQTFQVQVWGQDLREVTSNNALGGIFAAFFDMTYDAEQIEPATTNAISVPSYFSTAQSGSVVAGRFDEVGGVSNSTIGPGQSPQLVATLTLVAKVNGVPKVFLGPASDQGHDILVYAESVANGNGLILPNQIAFGYVPSSTPTDPPTPVDPPTPSNDPSVSISNASVLEGNSSESTLSFTLTLSKPSTQSIAVSYQTVELGTHPAGGSVGSAGFGRIADYVIAGTCYTLPFAVFAPGETSRTIAIRVYGDELAEADETIGVQIYKPANANLGNALGIGTIINDDAKPGVVIDPSAFSVEGTGDAKVRVSLSAAVSQTVTVVYTTVDDTAKSGIDYVARSGTLTFDPGEIYKNILVPVIDDQIDRGQRKFRVELTSATDALLSVGEPAVTFGSMAVVDLADNDQPTVSINPTSSVVEGDSGEKPMSFTVSLSAPSALVVTVSYSAGWINGAATADGYQWWPNPTPDYRNPGGVLTFAPGETTKTISIVVLGDAYKEADETFPINLYLPNNASLGNAGATGTIIDNDTRPAVLVVPSASAHEGVPAEFAISLSAPSSQAVTVAYQTENGSGKAGSDYFTKSGTLTFAPGTTTQNVQLAMVDDEYYRFGRDFNVKFSSPSNALLFGDTCNVTIDDNDPYPSLGVLGPASVVEGDSGTKALTYTISLTSALETPLVVRYRTEEYTTPVPGGGPDLVGVSGTVTLAAGALSKTVTVQVNGDYFYEADDGFALIATPDVSWQNGRVARCDTKIINDDPIPPAISIGNVSQVEGNTRSTFAFPVTLSASSLHPVTVAYETIGLGANANQDYINTYGTLTFAPGTVSQSINVIVLGNTTYENDRTIGVILSSPVNGTLASTEWARGLIYDDDYVPVVNVNGGKNFEGTSSGNTVPFTIIVGNANVGVAHPSVVTYRTVDVTAKAGQDYIAVSGTLTFSGVGSQSRTIDVPLIADSTIEPDEQFKVMIDSVVGGRVYENLSDTNSVAIVDDDTPRRLTIHNATIVEKNYYGVGNYSFQVTADFNISHPIRYLVTSRDRTAMGNADFVPISQTIAYYPGTTYYPPVIVLNSVDDNLVEPEETFELLFTSLDLASDGEQFATITIVDDDSPPQVQINDASVREGNSGFSELRFAVTLVAPNNVPVTISYKSFYDTQGYNVPLMAIPDGDFVSASGVLTFAPGETTKSIVVQAIGDTRPELDETFIIFLLSAGNTALTPGRDFGRGTILNDD